MQFDSLLLKRCRLVRRGDDGSSLQRRAFIAAEGGGLRHGIRANRFRRLPFRTIQMKVAPRDA